MTNPTTTRRIAGHAVTLTSGVRYTASRPFAERGRRIYPVTICEGPLSLSGHVAARIDGLTYEKAAALVNAFNNGRMSFDGRVW